MALSENPGLLYIFTINLRDINKFKLGNCCVILSTRKSSFVPQYNLMIDPVPLLLP